MSRRLAALVVSLLVAGTLFGSAAPAQAATLPAQFTDTTIATSLAGPTGIAFMPDGRMLVTTQPGRLLVFNKDSTTSTLALNLNSRMCTTAERGLLGVAAGRTITINGLTYTGPTTVTSWVGSALQLSVPAQAGYEFVSWSDGGAATHDYTTPAAATTVTATLRATTGTPPGVPTSVTASQTAAASAAINWSPPTSAGSSAITGYRVSRDGVDSAGEGAYTTTAAATVRTFTLTRLVVGRAYNLSVAAISAAGTGTAVTVPVTITAPTTNFAADTFERTVASGWGPAPTGGAWAIAGTASALRVGSGVGIMTLPAGSTRTATIPVSRSASDVQVTLSFDAVPNGGGAYATVVGRQVGSSRYTASAWVKAGGAVSLVVKRDSTVISSATVSGLTYTAGTKLQVRMQATGTGTTTLRAKLWRTGTTEPSTWLVTATDTTAALQATGTVGVQGYLSSSATGSSVIRFDNFTAKAP